MNGWLLSVELWLMRLGRWPLACGAVAVPAALLWSTLLPLTEQQVDREARLLDSLRQRAVAPAPDVTATPPDALAAFEARLATAEDVTRLMQQLWAQGESAGLQLNKVDYRTEEVTGAGFQRLSITLPMTGPYPAVRRLAFGLMTMFPSLSIDKLDMKRDQTASGRVETTIHLTLFTRP